MLRNVLLLAAALLAPAALAVPVRTVDAGGATVPLNGELAAGEQTIALRAGVAEVTVADGTELRLRSAGWWALPVTVDNGNGNVTVRVWRTGIVSGRATAAKDVELPASFTAYIESPLQPVAAPPIPRGTKFDCPIASDGSWTCEFPAETLDLAFRTKGFTPHYRWGVTVRPAQNVALGTLLWRKGASLVAWLDRESAKAAKKGAKATLTRMVAGAPSVTSAKLAVPVAEGTFTERGYVQLGPLPAGMFALEISAPGFAKTTLAPLEIYEGSESVLRRPLSLEPPIDIHIAITSPLDWDGERWRVRVTRAPDGGSPLGGASQELVADERGALVVAGESPGRFEVLVQASRGDFRTHDAFTVTSSADATRTIAIEQHEIRGRVTLGGEGLEADVIFGTRDGADRVTLQADEEGRFRGAVPKLGEQVVEIRSEEEGVDTLLQVTVAKDRAVELALPDSTVSGVVVDRDGQPVPAARVSAMTGTLSQWRDADERGRFRLRGLGGRVRVSGHARRGRDESAGVEVVLTDGTHLRDVELRLVTRRDVRGRVTSAGQPLPGASVSGYATSGGAVPRATTDLDGRFTLPLPGDDPGATFVIAAGGRTMAAFERLYGDAELSFDLETAGGELLVHLPRSTSFSIRQNGARLGLHELMEWTEARGRELFRDDGLTLSAPDLARGHYRACAVTADGEICREGTLTPRGTLTLDLR